MRARQLALACHPGPVAGVTAASAAYAVALGRGPGGAVRVAVAVLAGQLAVGWHNDLVDAARDARAGRRDKPVALGRLGRRDVALAAAAAAAAAVPLSLLSGWRAGLLHVGAVAAALAYNAGLKATPLSALPYLAAFGSLPVFVALGAPGAPLGPWWAPVAAALLGGGAHLVNVLPDLEADLAEGIRGLPHRLGRGRSLVAAGALVLAAAATLAFHGGAPGAAGIAGLAVSAAALGLAAGAARRAGSRAPFALVVAAAVADVGLLLAAGHG